MKVYKSTDGPYTIAKTVRGLYIVTAATRIFREATEDTLNSEVLRCAGIPHELVVLRMRHCYTSEIVFASLEMVDDDGGTIIMTVTQEFENDITDFYTIDDTHLEDVLIALHHRMMFNMPRNPFGYNLLRNNCIWFAMYVMEACDVPIRWGVCGKMILSAFKSLPGAVTAVCKYGLNRGSSSQSSHSSAKEDNVMMMNPLLK
jgi:hypothetical protein